MMLSNSVIDVGLIIGSIADERGEWTCDLVEQRLNLRAILAIAGGQLRGEDLSGLSVDPDVQLAPGSSSAGTMLLDQPLAGSTQLQPSAVDQQVHRPGACDWSCHLEGLGATAEGRMIRYSEIKTQELQDRVNQPLGLTQCQPEHRPQGQGCPDRQG